MRFTFTVHKFVITTIALIGSFMFSVNSQASLIRTYAYDGCNVQQDINNTPTASSTSLSTTNCSFTPDTREIFKSSSARAEIGHLGLEVISQYSNGASPGGQSTAAGNANAYFSDTINVSSSTTSLIGGVMSLEFVLDGAVTLDSPFDNLNWSEYARISLTVSSGTNGRNYLNYAQSLTYAGYTESGNLIANIDIINDLVIPQVTFTGETSCGQPNATAFADCSAVASFFNSATIMGALVYDSTGNLVTDALLQSESGFDYKEGFVSNGSVPEPSAIALMGLGLLGFAATRRKIKK